MERVKSVKVVILAGGLGTRLKLGKPKPLVEILGKPMVLRVVECVEKILTAQITVVGNPINIDLLRTVLKDKNVRFKLQDEPRGTAHAVICGTDDMDPDDDILIMYSDTPLFRSTTIKALVDHYLLKKLDLVFMSGLTRKRYPYAVVYRNDLGRIVKVDEHGEPDYPPPWEYSIGSYILKVGRFRELYGDLKPRERTGEYYVSDIIQLALERGYGVDAYICLDENEYLGVNTVDDLKRAMEILLEREISDMELEEEKKIRFGTGGWRARIGRGFTSVNIKKLTQAVVEHLKENHLDEKGVIVGYDNRFMSKEAAETIAEVLSANNVKVTLSKTTVPTPLVTFTVVNRKAGAGMVVTASHNPPDYNGIKFETDEGLPASEEITNEIERRANRRNHDTIPWVPFTIGVEKGYISVEDFRNDYLDYLERKIDYDAIRKKHLRICFDSMYGSGTSTVQMALIGARCDLEILHSRRDPLFGGRSPTPSLESLSYLMDRMKSGEFDVGIAVDGDADRIVLVDEEGKFIPTNDIIPILWYYLHEFKGKKGGVVRNIVTSHNIDRLCAIHDERVWEVPVGFKNVAEGMKKYDAIIGGESSGGIAFRDHILEKDGIFATLMVVEMLATTGKKLSDMVKEVKKEVKVWYEQGELNLRMTPEMKVGYYKLKERELKEIAGFNVQSINTVDGVKYILECERWISVRLSGTEPVIRIYAEALNKDETSRLIDHMKKLLISK